MMKMNDELKKYFLQYSDIFDTNVYIGNKAFLKNNFIQNQTSLDFEIIGNYNSNILFVEDFFIDSQFSPFLIKKSHDLFKKILESIKLSYKDIQIIRINRKLGFKNASVFNEFDKKIKNKTKKIIISLGSSILNDYQQIESFRNKKLKYKNNDLMFTYHPKELITNEMLKRNAWNDFKYLRDNLYMDNKKNLNNTIAKMMPYSPEAEKAVLGCMLINQESVSIAIQKLSSTSFEKKNSLIFKNMERLFNDNENIDYVSLGNELEKNKELELIGGYHYLTGLANNAPSAESVDYYANIVKEYEIKRRIIEVSQKINDEAYESKEDANNILDKAEQILF